MPRPKNRGTIKPEGDNMNRIEILIRPKAEFRTRNDIAIHALSPTYAELVDHVQQAEKNMFKLIVIYTDKGESMHNIFNGNSTWNKLRRDFGDVRYGEVGYQHGRSLGGGFKIYLNE